MIKHKSRHVTRFHVECANECSGVFGLPIGIALNAKKRFARVSMEPLLLEELPFVCAASSQSNTLSFLLNSMFVTCCSLRGKRAL
jgi:hypothetical protein